MSPAAGRRAWLLPGLALGALGVVRAGVVDERDPYWQVRAGLENLAGAPLSRPDTWSWAPVPGRFTQTSPAWNDALALAWRAAGFAGFFTLALLSMLLYVGVALALARRLGARPMPTLVGALPLLLLALPMVSPRATLVAQTLVLGALLAADHARVTLARTAPALLVAAGLAGGLVVAWAGSWLHLSWLLLAPGLWLCLVVLALGTPSASVRHRVAALGGAGLGLAGGVLAGPYGTGAWGLTRAVQDATSGVVLEWMSPLTAGLALRWLPAVVVALAGAVLGTVRVVRRWGRRGSDPRVGLLASLLVLAAPTAVGGLLGIRFIGVALLALVPVAGLGATALAGRAARRATASPATGLFRSAVVRRWSVGRPWRVVTVLVLVAVSPLVVLAGARLGRPPEAGAVDLLPRGCRLFSDPASAGPVLLLRPDVRVWVDTRADYWGRDRNREALDVLAGDDASAAPVAGADCVLLSTTGALPTAGLVRALDADPAWSARGGAGGVRVWVRPGAGR